jgi:Tfp pilus assembly protein PilE
MIRTSPQRGFTLLIAIILSTVVLTVGLALLDVAYKQVILSSTAKQSQAAFYNADSALECALFYDQKKDSFDFSTTTDFTVTNGTYNGSDPTVHITKFAIPCVGGGISASTTIYKYTNGATSLYADGFNTCTATDPRRVDRGLKATYGDATLVIAPPPSGNRSFAISPAVSGKSTWNLDSDGPLTLANGTWTITPSSAFTTTVTANGGGGGSGGGNPGFPGGAGGKAAGTVSLSSGVAYTVSAARSGLYYYVAGLPGGGSGQSASFGGGGGGGYSGILNGGTGILIAGGGGGGGWGGTGAGNGGGTTGVAGATYGNPGGGGGTQVTGGTNPLGQSGVGYTGGSSIGDGQGNGGAGGGGYWGGASGAGYALGGSQGGGGSGYINPALVSAGVLTTGAGSAGGTTGATAGSVIFN